MDVFSQHKDPRVFIIQERTYKGVGDGQQGVWESYASQTLCTYLLLDDVT